MRILLIDDHGILRAGVKSLIQAVHHDAQVLEASCTSQALALVRSQAFDVIFLDLCIPTSPTSNDLTPDNGLSLLSLFKSGREEPSDPDPARCVVAPVIVMSAESERRFVDEVMRRGASSYVPKSSAHEAMLEAINRALSGGVYLPSEAIGKGGQAPAPSLPLQERPVTPLGPKDLGVTPREFDILRLALQGNAPWKIAAILEINPVNVRQYLSKLYSKFGVIDLYGLQSLFAKTGQVLGVLSSPASPALACRPRNKSC
ncbi:response regulator transcription factor [Pseudomonas sp. S 311-6]|uniref:response regulator transcription factor n=1 Tax=Pseudomonas TaxID=286 RepID=UPI0020983217|nr:MULTISPECIES: response regulator transcription factor [Pseudomonas]MCO7565560.1 response regulator transcription factor [Pseudomonas mosselii]MCO7617668.1 response regulator transcription factor [Pseudomonas guariconensis]MCO7640248.1 response regulator transcription factor [Pseudomonas sp. S 311-6]